MTRHYDLIVTGAGSGNMLIDESFSHLDVAVVEAGPFGGTCLNRGCIPSKMLSYPAELADSIAGGLDLHDDGRIVVDEYQRAGVDGVFALGDVCTDTPLEHVANREAEIVAHNLRHPDTMRAKGSEPVPAAVFTNPQIASVGLTQAQCRDKGLRYAVGRAKYADIAYGWAMGDPPGFAKVLVDVENALLDA